MRWYLTALRKYAVFRGRSRRREYWMFNLINCGIVLALVVLGGTLSTGGRSGFGGLGGLYSVATLVPSLAVGVRRLHDTGRSGWWLLLGCIPVVGLVVLVFTLMDSEPRTNRYGPSPKARAEAQPISDGWGNASGSVR